MDEFFTKLKYAKRILSCKGWILERTNEVRSVVVIKRRMADGTKKYLLKFEKDINSLEDVRYLGDMLKNLEHHLSRVANLNC